MSDKTALYLQTVKETTQYAWAKFVLAPPVLFLVVITTSVFPVSYYSYDVFYRSLANSTTKFIHELDPQPTI